MKDFVMIERIISKIVHAMFIVNNVRTMDLTNRGYRQMKTDIDGCSTTKPGQEQWEEYFSEVLQKDMIQYDYRKPDGKLFSCVAPSLEVARQKKKKWLKNQERK